MKSLCLPLSLLSIFILTFSVTSVFAKPSSKLCSTYTDKTLEALEHSTNQAKSIVAGNKSLISIGNDLCKDLETLLERYEIKKIFTPEKNKHIKEIVTNHAHNIKGQVTIVLNEGIYPEFQCMSQRIEDLFKDDQEKIKGLSQKIETTIKQTLQKKEVKDSIKKLEIEGKKLEAQFKKLFK